ncbi:metal ABC transporter ATP-binding protein [Corynebacterium resistens]|uniref:metal ABC transporter ATP-binding protein n=1 Tax=Corynebacterium resistens TaxID=258224 RepID=UPI00235302F3|nr:metal ABC transporter ATP-binding protein [Corynebacterium resistens]
MLTPADTTEESDLAVRVDEATVYYSRTRTAGNRTADTAKKRATPNDADRKHTTRTHPHGSAPALEHASTSIRCGHVKALIGPNGSGKSTLFKAIMGLVPLHHGNITRFHNSPGSIAYVPQHESVDWNFPISVEDVVASGRYAHPTRRGIFGGRWLGRHTSTDREAIESALQIANLSDLRARQIGQLSGGQRKRVFVARGIAQGANTLLLDEPFAGVDNTSRDGLTSLFTTLAHEGKALLVATHDIDHLPTFCDEVVMLNRTVIADGPTHSTLTDENLLATFSGVARGVGNKKQPEQTSGGERNDE